MLLNQFLLLSAVLFCIGVYGVLVRRNGVLVLMSIEMILNAVNINLVAFGTFHGISGQVFALVRHRGGGRGGGRGSRHRAAHLPEPPLDRHRPARRAEGVTQ